MSSTFAVVTVQDQIAAQLRADVQQGVYAPGAPLREEQLAARFGVSRSPIRQVLQQLAFEGLLHYRPNYGVVVASPPSDEVRAALYECRARLETIALRQCFPQLDADDFRRWESILDEMYETCRRNDHAAADHQDALFHRLIVDKASAAGSLGVYHAIAAATRDYSVDRNRRYDDLCELYAVHAALYATIRAGEVDVACEAVEQHILRRAFNVDVRRCWYESGKPRDWRQTYDSLFPALRTAARRRSDS